MNAKYRVSINLERFVLKLLNYLENFNVCNVLVDTIAHLNNKLWGNFKKMVQYKIKKVCLCQSFRRKCIFLFCQKHFLLLTGHVHSFISTFFNSITHQRPVHRTFLLIIAHLLRTDSVFQCKSVFIC